MAAMTVLRRKALPQQGETRAQRRLERAVLMLEQYRRNGLTTVSIEDVLVMLGTDPGPEPARVSRDPRADPLTGALWAGPPGTMPPAA